MELKIFNSILFGELQPFTGNNREEKYFTSKLNPTFKVPGTMEEFEAELKKALAEHPFLLNKEEYYVNLNPEEGKIEISGIRDEVFEPGIDIDIPPYFNSTTEYYYYLIKNEGTRIIHELAHEIQAMGTHADGRFLLQKVLLQTEYLLKNTAKELKFLPKTDIPFYQPTNEETDTERIQMNTHFVYYTLQITLIRVYYEILSTFSSFVGDLGKIESELYAQVLGKTPPEITYQKVSKGLAIRRAQNIAETQDFKEDKAHSVLKELHDLLISDISNSKLIQAITAIENRLFIEAQLEDPKQHSFEDLYAPSFADSLFKTIKVQYKAEIEQFVFGHERFEQIEEIQDASNILPELPKVADSTLKHSVCRKLNHWLETQKELYRNHFTQAFTATQIGKGSNDPKATPKAKRERPDFASQKGTARNFLNFFSGNNPQQDKIMKDDDYNRLLQMVDFLIENEKLPDKINKISQINISTGMIRYTFYLIHKELYTTKNIKPEWIDFLHAVFEQFKNIEWNTTKTKFSVKPSSYQHDMKSMKR